MSDVTQGGGIFEAAAHGGFPLSPQQRRLWALHRADPAAPWRAQMMVRLDGDLDAARLQAAIGDVVARYEVLRTSFPCPPGMKEPLQVIGEPDFLWEHTSAPGGLGAAERAAWLESLWHGAAVAPHDLERGPALAASLVTLEPGTHLLSLRLPALCADAVSLVRLAAEVAEAYASAGDAGAEEPLQYADLASWQNELLDSEDSEEGRAFWRRLEIGPALAFPLPFLTAGRRAGHAPRLVALPLSAELGGALARRAEELGAPLSSLLLAGWLALLSRLSGEREIAAGVAFDGRSYDGLGEALGPLARSLPVAAACKPDLAFSRLVAEVQQRVGELYERQEYFDWEDLPGIPVPTAGCTAAFDFTELPPRRHAADLGLTLERLSAGLERARLRLSWTRREGVLRGELHYDETALERTDALRTAGQLATLLAGVAAAPETPLARLPVLTPDERRRLTFELNDTARPLPEGPVHRLFEVWADRTPEAPAVVFEEERLTFAEVEERANRLAHHLRGLGVGPDVPVALLLPRSHEVVVAILAVLKAGGCYVPLDPGLPVERAAFLLVETAAPVVICLGDPPPELAGSGVRLVRLDADAEELARRSSARPALRIPPESGAYVLFTSGSTGRPKGVVVEHRQLVSYVAGVTERLGLPPGARYAMVSTFAADLGNTVVFPALTTGGCLHVIAQERLSDPEAMARYFELHAIDCLKIVPSHLEALQASARPERVMPRRCLVLGGEASRREWLDRLQELAPECRILNHYGPTETTVGVLTHAVDMAGPAARMGVPLGRPLANARVYVVDRELEPAPTWAAGEIAIGGASVARGYLGRPDLTAERFLPDPWSERPGGRLYRTGDLGRCRGQGVFEFLGRIDDQVKIRGFRVEPGEIEALLREHAAVQAAAVLAREDRPGQRRLVAYAAIAPESGATPAELTAFLAARLPDFMVPAAMVILQRLPLNANGKVDRQRLPAPEAAGPSASAGHVAPRTELERVLAEVWSEVLGLERVGVEDSFFQLGGDSIRSIGVRGRALERGLDFSVAELFENPTIAQLAKLLAGRAGVPVAAARRTVPFELVAAHDRARLPADVEDAYPLTRLQAGMLFHSELNPGTAIYHDIHSFHLRVRLDLPLLERAAAGLVARHAVLRTSFDLSSYSEALQLVHREANLPVRVFDLRGLPVDRQEREIAAWLVEERRRSFDWSQAPLLALFVHRRTEETLQFTLSFHHSIFDGWSTASLTAELFSRYMALLEGDERPAEPPLAVAFRDFVALERQALESEEHRSFWQRQLAGRTVTRLPRWAGDRGRESAGEAQALPFPVPAEVGRALKELAESAGAPVKSVFLAAHLKVLSGLSGDADVITGLVSNGRPEEVDGERVLGLFLNTVPFRLSLEPGRWLDLVRATFRAEQDLTPYRRYPLVELQRAEGGEPLFETAFNYVHYHVYKGLVGAPGLDTLGQTGYEETNFPFGANFALSLGDASVLFWLSYRTSDLTREQCELIAGHYLAVMRSMAADPEAQHAAFSPLSAAERHQLVVEWNDTAAEPAVERCLHELLAEQAARTPDAPAVTFEGEHLTYLELDARANALARRLAASGVGPEVCVAVAAERSLELLVGLLAVLKAGGAYVPIDASYPAERLAFLFADSGARLVLTQERVLARLSMVLPQGAVPVLLDGVADAGGAEEGPNPAVRSEHPAYVIYTSGSTGLPKGVVVPHRGLVHYLAWAVRAYRVEEGRGAPVHSPLGFDLTVTSLFAPLLAGRTVALLREERGLAPLTEALRGPGGFSLLKLTPAHLAALAPDLPELGLAGWAEVLILGGEALAGESLAAWRERAPRTRLINEYGPTETVVGCAVYEVPPGAPLAGSVPIGRPIACTEIHLLDAGFAPVPLGVPGELYIGGPGVARGYLGRPALTAERFVPHPFATSPGERLYRSGDLARRWPDGTLEFLGRRDDQVKIRGHRIELGEVEAALAAHPDVRETAVVARQDASGDKRLVAYVVAAPKAELRPGELRSFLEERLPDPMIPAAFVRLDALPLTANGKLDRRALPAPGDGDLLEAGFTYVQPRNPDEELLAGVWAEMLGRERVGVEDDFFALGGDSLVATRVVSRVRRLLGLEVPLRALFEAPTVAALSLRIAALRRSRTGFVLPPLVPVPRSGALPLSFAQERLWFLDQLAPGNAAYHIHRALAFEGPLDAAALAACVAEILRRHEALRTRFVTVGGVPAQEIVPSGSWHLPSVDLSALPPRMREREARRLAAAQAVRPFDLTRDLLLRVVLLRLAAEEHAALLTMHHIAGDGWSMGVLVQEVAALYEAFTAGRPSPLPELPIQYVDFAQWQRQWLQGEVLAGQMAYWRTQLGEGAPASELPADRPRPAVQSFRGAARRFELSAETTSGLHALARREGVSLFMALLAAVDTVLCRYTGRDDVVLGSPIANRNFAEVEGLIGFFVNTLALRVYLGGEPSFRELLARTREVSLGAYAHQDLPFEKLVEELQPERDPSRNPLFQVMLTLQNAPAAALTLSGLRLKSWDVEHRSTRFDLELMLWEAGGGMSGSLIYASDLFDLATVVRFGEHLRRILAAATETPDLPLSRLPLLSGEERFQVVAEWNDTATAYPQDVCLHALIEAQVRCTPGAVAVTFEGGHLTYRELDRAANALAHRLREHGVGPEVTVGVCVERSLELVVGLLGILKAGGAYVPLDPSNPHERLRYMIQDSRVPVLLTQQHLSGGLPDLARSCGAEVLLLDGVPPADGPEGEAGPASGVRPDNLAYVIYTSGSTGQPKGAMNTHRAIVNRLLWMQDAYGLTADDAVLQKTPFSFDVSVWEFFWPLLTGARLVVARPGGHQESAYLARLIAGEGVTTVHFVPSMLAVFLEEPEVGLCRGLRRVIASGEALSLGLEQRFFARLDVPLHNLYGPTEAAVDVTAWACERGHGRAVVPIGRPISNLRLHILDASFQPVPVGVPGELYIGGVGLARGYFARPALTAERFLPDPFATAEQPGGRLYWTGDLARYLADGSIDFLGRVDHQVKIRGFRIELGEIEAALLAHPAVREAAVVDREDGPGGRRLVAYVVPDPDWTGEEEPSPEPAVASDQVSEWQALYDEVYSEPAEAGDPTFDIRSWDSSYTGEPIPADEMREWVERTVERILALRPRRVLEIGCGSGLLLYRVAPHCERYLATDFSMAVVRRLQAQLARPGWELPQVELSCRTATDFTGIAEGGFDLVVLNSVVQYFPSGEYLLSVLEGAVRSVRPGGFVFVGDVRNLDLLEAFHASVQLFQAPAALPAAQWRERVRRRAAEDRELVVAPAFWSGLAQRLPEIGEALVQVKRGRAGNELTRFRYDVVLSRGDRRSPAAEPKRLDWVQGGLDLAALGRWLAAEQPDAAVVTRVPNRRVAGDLAALEAGNGTAAPAITGELAELAQRRGSAEADPEDLWALAADLGYAAEVGWSAEAPGVLDVVFRRPTLAEWGVRAPLAPEPVVSGPLPGTLASRPLRVRLARRLVPELRSDLAGRLPEYMVPSAFCVLESLPLTAHGKLDRRSLPAPELGRDLLEAAFEPPGTPTEQILAGLWSQVLGVDRIGARDDFFRLGGHSLLATQLLSRLRDVFGVEIPLRALFQSPTLAELAAVVGDALKAGDTTQAPPIAPAPRQGPLPLSFAQGRLWFLDQLDPGKGTYNLHSSFHLRGPLDAAALARSFTAVVERHEALRTTFRAVDGVPEQMIALPAPVPLPLIDLRDLPRAVREAEARRLSATEARRSFDLARGPLLRLGLLRLGAEHHLVLATVHHIVSDGWSMGIFHREMAELYAGFATGEPRTLPDLPVQYADFAAWQRRWLAGPVLEAELDFWRQRLAGAPPMLELPADRPRPPIQRFRGDRLTLQLGPAATQALRDLSLGHGVTLFMTLLAAFQALLCRYTGQEDLLVGTPIAGRSRREIEGLIGLFVNTLVLRTDLSGDPRFPELLARVRETSLAAHAHQDLPLERLVDELQPGRSLSHSPLFQVLFVMQNALPTTAAASDLYLEPLETDSGAARFDLTLDVLETSADLVLRVDYDVDLFDAATIGRLLGHYETLLAALIAGPGRRLGELPLLTAPERQQLLVEWALGPAGDVHGVCIHELFAAQAARTPDAIALVYEDQRLTYRELDRLANRLAHRLRAMGVGPDVRVGLCVERSPEMVWGLLGILKAGGAYVPLDPEYPAERLAFLIEDTGPPVLLTQERLLATLPAHAARVLCLDGGWAAGDPGAGDEAPDVSVTPDHLAYVIHTSGSTGLPKGSLIAHRGVSNQLLWRQRCFPLGAQDRVLQTDSFSFDPSAWQFFWPLLAGARLVLVRPGGNKESGYLVRLLAEHEITVVGFVPSMLAVILEEPGLERCRSLRHLFCGGEALRPELSTRFFQRLPGAELHNVYGPTEASIDATDATYRSPEDASVARIAPIGRPIGNKALYVLDAEQRLVPAGVAGELYVGGVGLARGYLGRPELTAERFVPDPFTAGRPGARLYRTGDLVRYLRDGAIEFLGRIDHQVKVRGFRIELGEVESVLGEHPAVRERTVVVREDEPGVKRLVAYYVTEPEALVGTSELRAFLQQKLPAHMVPAVFVRLEALPLSPNGKVDRRALPEPEKERPELASDFLAPRGEIEQTLAEIWARVLGVARVGVHDNFFDLGGDSILSIQIVARAGQAGLRLTPRDIFQHQTIAELAAVAGTGAALEAEQGPVTGTVPLTPIQRWFFERELGSPRHFNQAVLLEVREPLSPALLAGSLAHLLAHHDALRLRFTAVEGGVAQEILPPSGAVPFSQIDLAALPRDRRSAAVEAVAQALHGGFDLARGPLTRLALFELGAGESGRLFWVTHHLAVDGVSWRILLEDLEAAYRQLERGEAVALPPKTTSFKRWSERLTEHARSETLRRELSHWLAQRSAAAAPLPLDVPEAAAEDTMASADVVWAVLGNEETRALLQEVPQTYHTQINDALLTALVQAFGAWTGRSVLLVDLEGHGREDLFDDVDLSRTVGWFTAVFPVLLDVGGCGGPGEALKAVKEQLRRIPQRGVGYGVLRYLSPDPEVLADLADQPRAEVSFNYLGQLDHVLTGSSPFAGARESSGTPHSPRARRTHRIEIDGSISGGRLRMGFRYGTRIHRRDTIERLATEFIAALRALIDHCLAPETGGFTSSDFPLAQLDEATLGRLSERLSLLENDDDEEFAE